MDIARPDRARNRRRKRILFAVTALAAVALITIALSRLKPAAPIVENAYTGIVKRGEMLREVRGNGTLIPEEIRWIPTLNAGRIENILVFPGAAVKPDTILVELSNPEVEQSAFDAEWGLKAAEAEFTNLQVQVESQYLTQQAVARTAQANYSKAKMEADVNRELAKSGLIPALTLRQSESNAEDLAKLNEIEQERLKMAPKSGQAQLAVQSAKVKQLHAQLELKRQLVNSLKVRAGMDGILQKLGDLAPLQIGQEVTVGANLARVANPTRLKAEIKVAETQAKDITSNQSASIDTRNGIIPGHVIRIDPAVQNGTVTVEVGLDGPLPKGARPDLSIDGTIMLERLTNVLYVGRPVQGQPESTMGIFKVQDGGKSAARVTIKLGRSSVSTIEVLQGLKEGDQIVLSDMSSWDAYPFVRLR